jgi:hypothetical protein
MPPSEFPALPAEPASEPRRFRLQDRLRRLVGPGAAAFYRDACSLMGSPDRLLTASHLVAHALREIESSLRHALTSVTTPQNLATAATRRDLRESLRIATGRTSARSWLRLTCPSMTRSLLRGCNSRLRCTVSHTGAASMSPVPWTANSGGSLRTGKVSSIECLTKLRRATRASRGW